MSSATSNTSWAGYVGNFALYATVGSIIDTFAQEEAMIGTCFQHNKEFIHLNKDKLDSISKKLSKIWSDHAENYEVHLRKSRYLHCLNSAVMSIPLLNLVMTGSSVLGLLGTGAVTVFVLTPVISQLAIVMLETYEWHGAAEIGKSFQPYFAFMKNLSLTTLFISKRFEAQGLYAGTRLLAQILCVRYVVIPLLLPVATKTVDWIKKRYFSSADSDMSEFVEEMQFMSENQSFFSMVMRTDNQVWLFKKVKIFLELQQKIEGLPEGEEKLLAIRQYLKADETFREYATQNVTNATMTLLIPYRALKRVDYQAILNKSLPPVNPEIVII